MTEVELSNIREDVKLAKKQFYTKMDELKESAMKDAKFFEKNFSALTHASVEKQKLAPGISSNFLPVLGCEMSLVYGCSN